LESVRRTGLTDDDYYQLFHGFKISKCSLDERKRAVDLFLRSVIPPRVQKSISELFVSEDPESETRKLWDYIREKTPGWELC
jgi:hypothetical protein